MSLEKLSHVDDLIQDAARFDTHSEKRTSQQVVVTGRDAQGNVMTSTSTSSTSVFLASFNAAI